MVAKPQILGQGLQRDGLASASGAGDQAVAVGLVGQQVALDNIVVGAMLGNEDAGVVEVGHEILKKYNRTSRVTNN